MRSSAGRKIYQVRFKMENSNLQDKNILLGITGSIAAYKSAEVIRLLRKRKAKV